MYTRPTYLYIFNNFYLIAILIDNKKINNFITKSRTQKNLFNQYFTNTKHIEIKKKNVLGTNELKQMKHPKNKKIYYLRT